MLLNLADDRYVNLDDIKRGIVFLAPLSYLRKLFLPQWKWLLSLKRKADAINEFENTYGISARALLLSDITTSTKIQQDKIRQEMALDNTSEFEETGGISAESLVLGDFTTL